MMKDIFSITVGRELGSGGREVARLLAEEFQCKLYDSEILSLAAKESGFSEDLFKNHDEHHGRLHNLLFSKMPNIGHAHYYSEQVSQGSLFSFQSEVIRREAERGRCVFVGRAADYILREKDDVVSIFVYADLDYRIQKVMERHHCTADEARKLIHKEERKRAVYYDYYTGQRWGERQYYDLCLNSCRLGIKGTAEIVSEYVRQRMKND